MPAASQICRCDVGIEPAADLLENPAYASVVTRNPTPTERANVCSGGPLAGTPNECLNAAVSAIVDLRLQNIALLQTSGVDLVAKYSSSGTYGQITTPSTVPTSFVTPRHKQGTPPCSALNTIGNPVNIWLRAAVARERRELEIANAVNFTDGYRDTDSLPNRNFASYTTADLKFSYQSNAPQTGWRGDTALAINVRNVLNRGTPFVNNPLGIGYDPSNGNRAGRLSSLSVQKIW